MVSDVAGAPLPGVDAGISDELAALVERVRAGVVRVSDGRGAGAGTIWGSDGLIVTNYHVVPGQQARVAFEDGTELQGRVVRNLPERDLAVLKVDVGDLQVLPVGDSRDLRPGELVLAVGNPLGVPGAASIGVFSGIGPVEGRPGKHLREALRADVVLRPGNSGGPLVNMRGEVIGINAMVMGPRTALAIPSATVARLLGPAERRALGVSIGLLPGHEASIERDVALIVLDVMPRSVAARAGLLPGDILLALDGQPLEEPGDVAWVMMGVMNSRLVITILRAGRIIDLSVGL